MSDQRPLLSSNSNAHNSQVNYLTTVKKVAALTFFSNPVNYLLFFVPIGLLSGKLGFTPTVTFIINFLAIIPLASVLAFATEELSEHVGQIIGGLLNATIGNAVELIVSIIAIEQNQIRVVQASMLGSILSNLLLVLGCSFVAGGYNRLQQTFNKTVAQTMSSLLALAVIGLLIPAAFHASLPDPAPGGEFPSPGTSDDKILSLSRGTAIILLTMYVLYLFFQLKTHREFFDAQDQALENAASTADEQLPLTSQDNNSKLGAEDNHLSLPASLIVLFLVTFVVLFSADFLVGSIDGIVESSGLSKTFIGLIIIPIVGNAAEHVTAIFVATKDKMDLAIGVAVGSSIQIALFVTPFMVLFGWIIDAPMSLFFSTFETAVMFSSVLITNYLILDGESNWLEGTMLISTYIIIAISFFYYPDELAA